MLERLFKLSENNTKVKTEFIAGLITFLTMAYILVVNPKILANTGMDENALFSATIYGAIIGTVLMGLLANLPIAQASGMGLNTFFAFTIVATMGCTWQTALAAVFIEGIIFIFLTFFNIREIIVQSIPQTLKDAIPAGIGLFIAFIGLQNSEIITSNSSTYVAIGDFANHNVWIATFGFLITIICYIRKWDGAILIGIIAATIFSFAIGDSHWPQEAIVSLPPSIKPIFWQFHWHDVLNINTLIIVFVLLIVNLFDSVGTLLAVVSKITGSTKTRFPLKRALLSDAIGTTCGAIFGTSTISSYVESAAGVAAGGRTGLTAISTAFFFALSLFFYPLVKIVPSAAISAPLVIIGFFMMSSVLKIDFENMSEGLPAFITILFMPFTYSIASGICFGVLSFVFIKIFAGKFNQLSLTILIVAFMFLVKIILDAYHITT